MHSVSVPGSKQHRSGSVDNGCRFWTLRMATVYERVFCVMIIILTFGFYFYQFVLLACVDARPGKQDTAVVVLHLYPLSCAVVIWWAKFVCALVALQQPLPGRRWKLGKIFGGLRLRQQVHSFAAKVDFYFLFRKGPLSRLLFGASGGKHRQNQCNSFI